MEKYKLTLMGLMQRISSQLGDRLRLGRGEYIRVGGGGVRRERAGGPISRAEQKS